MILLEDARALIIDKPAGLPVHPGRAGGPSVEDFFPRWRRGKTGPWLAHRLDQDTAGCLLIARRKNFLLQAQKWFAEGEVEKTYWAVLEGDLAATEGIVDLPLAKQTVGKGWKMGLDPNGAPAITAWRVLGRAGSGSWVEFSPRTGRTHQIRAHAAALGHPILGDPVYGAGQGRLQLLARRLALPEPGMVATAPVPAHMQASLKACGHDPAL